MGNNKKCEVCGELKPHAEFSKSYKKRCKPCVAEQARSIRKLSVKKNKLDPSAELIAESVAVFAECLGMFSFNQDRVMNGLSPGYLDNSFSYFANTLRDKIETFKNQSNT